jgi:hypothetical protein
VVILNFAEYTTKMTDNPGLPAIENHVITDYMTADIILIPVIINSTKYHLTLTLCALLEFEMCIFIMPRCRILT